MKKESNQPPPTVPYIMDPKNAIGKEYLITTDNWFFANDGQNYRAVWGKIMAISTAVDTLGIKPNGKSTNWYVTIGTIDNHVIIAGCQIHYAVRTAKQPYSGGNNSWSTSAEHGINQYKVPNTIYFAIDEEVE